MSASALSLVPAAEWALAWAGTYLVHSTLALAGAWCGARYLLQTARARDVAWKLALVVPLVSATLQVAQPGLARGPRWALAVEETAGPLPPLETSFAPRPIRPIEPPEPRAAEPRAFESSVTLAEPRGERSMKPFAIAGLVLLILWCLLRITAPEIRLARRLRPRRPLRVGALHEALVDLAPRARIGRVRLTTSEGAPAPLAFGVLRPEICVPPRAVAELEGELARALVAHELAHLARRDPLWSRLARALETLLFFQPLLRLARRELESAAELCADDLAVQWTNDGVGLARCLAEVASWLQGTRNLTRGAATLAMVRRAEASALRRRVERALEARASGWTRSTRYTSVAAALAAVATLSLAGPGVARSIAAEDPISTPNTGVASPYASVLEAEGACLIGLTGDLEELERHPDPEVRRRATELRLRARSLEAERQNLVRGAAAAHSQDR